MTAILKAKRAQDAIRAVKWLSPTHFSADSKEQGDAAAAAVSEVWDTATLLGAIYCCDYRNTAAQHLIQALKEASEGAAKALFGDPDFGPAITDGASQPRATPSCFHSRSCVLCAPPHTHSGCASCEREVPAVAG